MLIHESYDYIRLSAHIEKHNSLITVRKEEKHKLHNIKMQCLLESEDNLNNEDKSPGEKKKQQKNKKPEQTKHRQTVTPLFFFF